MRSLVETVLDSRAAEQMADYHRRRREMRESLKVSTEGTCKCGCGRLRAPVDANGKSHTGGYSEYCWRGKSRSGKLKGA